MTRACWILMIFLAGCLLKVFLLWLWVRTLAQTHFSGVVQALAWGYDRLLLFSAERTSAILCPPGGIGPSTCTIMVFDVWLVVGFGLECAALAFLVTTVWRHFCNRAGGAARPD